MASTNRNLPSKKEIEAIYRELDEKNRQLKELDKLKSEFISNVSHELRTPLSIIKEGICLILDKIPGDINQKQEDLLVIAKRNIDRLADIINDLLDMSRIEGGKIQLKRSRVSLKEMMDKLIPFFEANIKRENLALHLKIPETAVEVYADQDRIKQVFSNLVENAIKFTPTGAITISLKETDAVVECAISDTGKGISQDKIPLIFDKFSQIDRKHGPGRRGTGLGLAICKEIVKLHGGNIWTISEENKGTTVHFTIPKSILSACLISINGKLACLGGAKAKQSMVLITINLNNAKEILETLGETACVKAVNGVENIVSRYVTRPGDTVNTCFPDRFFLLLPHTGKKGANIVCKKIKDGLRSSNIVYGGEKIFLDISFGVARFPEDGKTAEALVKRSEDNVILGGS